MARGRSSATQYTQRGWAPKPRSLAGGAHRPRSYSTHTPFRAHLRHHGLWGAALKRSQQLRP
eukprot:5765618-Prymnesium_polylepis.1